MRYLAGRLLSGGGTLLVVTILVFAAVHAVPGSYTQIVLGPYATPQAKANIEARYGLDRPLTTQYLRWLRHVAVGDFGTSLASGRPVSDVLVQRLPVTLELTVMALILALLFGLPLALAAGLARTRFGRGGSRLGGAMAISTPDFVVGSVVLYLFSRYSLGLPVGQYQRFGAHPIESVRDMLLPALVLSIFGVALIVRIGRDSIAGVLSAPHVTAALARGESKRHIVRHHVLRNSAIPVLTVLAIYVGYLMGGAVVIESLFSLPGLGQAALSALQLRDYGVVQGVVLIAAAAFIGVNIVADVAYGIIDPRVRASKS